MSMSLQGIRVLDLSRVLAGPYCSMILADLGADVTKVEAPGGSDETRQWGPPYQEGVSAYYLCANRNKRSLTVDLKSKEGKRIIEQLVENSDVVLHNFRTGKMERLGLGYEQLKSINEQIVYCSITGFGETGPYAHLPGYDYIIQAMSGLMSITGDEQSGPQKLGVAITDVLTGLYACIGIQAAFIQRERTGQGQQIDLSLYDCAISSLVNIASNYLMSGHVPQRLGKYHANIAPYQSLQTADGEMVIAVGNDKQFNKLCKLIGKEELANDKRFKTNSDRVYYRKELETIVEQQWKRKTTAEWQHLCRAHSIPTGPIQAIDQVMEDPQVQARDMLLSTNHPKAGRFHMVGSPLKLSESPITMRRHPPEPGEHTGDILQSLGYTREAIERFKKQGIID
ncbi:CaiB/BaiF CoA transferase family protein [Pontibacillus litoralis]|uniref:CoA transferase n=1 Tax=Pontibacillus litoralis JSM 072002 TaxID=1385512 RepID=A0A0A5G1D8_9BACI|nr:CoA transferase [Pontibacillus litoralis]KGX86916.1 CoA transferase [Pontibacillus litoralis JSM 072002]